MEDPIHYFYKFINIQISLKCAIRKGTMDTVLNKVIDSQFFI